MLRKWLLYIILLHQVGLLDAATHFSASIHDIAKSVNVLDRRLQPVLKLRLPYTFGFMSVLAPFHTNEARATQILKKCPLKEGFKNTEPGKLEYVIDVEILPSMGTEVFVIVTSLRVVLVRVKGESIGVWTATTFLEIYFSDDALYSSKVDDYGHSSVALIVYKRSRDKNLRSESKRAGILFALSPQLAWKTVASRFGGVTLDQDISNPVDIVESNFDPDDITGTDDEGTLIDKFTILADYQYQRELTRLHNVISCILGNYDALIYDNWLSVGRQCRTDGYTSFGMYFFERNDTPEIQTNFVRPTVTLTSLPWVGYQTFSKAGRSTVTEQKELLVKLRDTSCFTNELDAAQWEGGPAWLVDSLANATYESYTYASPLLPRNASSSFRISNGSESNPRMLPAIDFDNYENSLTLHQPHVASEIPNATNSMLLQDLVAENFQSPIVSSSILHRDSRLTVRDPIMRNSSTSSYQSFHTANNNNNTISPNVEGPVSASQSLRNSIWTDAAESEPQDVPAVGPSHLIPNTKQVTPVDDVKTKDYDQTKNVDGNHRLDRMEQLMERLLMFTADQTVLRHPPSHHMMVHHPVPTNHNNNDLQYTYNTLSQQRMWNEITELRAMIMQQQQSGHQRSDPTDTPYWDEPTVSPQRQPLNVGFENDHVAIDDIVLPPLVTDVEEDDVVSSSLLLVSRPESEPSSFRNDRTNPIVSTSRMVPDDRMPQLVMNTNNNNDDGNQEEWSVEQVD